MSTGNLRWHVAMLVSLPLLSFCAFDEEPVVDFTDGNLLHVWLLVVSVGVILFEPTLRANVGQFVYKDLVSLVAALTFGINIENYVRLVLVVFYLHNLLPFEVDLLEHVEILALHTTWATTVVLPTLGLLYACLALTHALNLQLTNAQHRASLDVTFAICLCLLMALGVLGWDFLTTSLSSAVEGEASEVFYVQPRTGGTYDRSLRTGDQFEGHRERQWPYSLRFEDLYFFFLQLLLFGDLFCSLCCWSFLFISAAMSPARALSATQLSVGLFGLEQAAVAVLTNLTLVGAPSLRLWARTPVELCGLGF